MHIDKIHGYQNGDFTVKNQGRAPQDPFASLTKSKLSTDSQSSKVISGEVIVYHDLSEAEILDFLK